MTVASYLLVAMVAAEERRTFSEQLAIIVEEWEELRLTGSSPAAGQLRHE